MDLFSRALNLIGGHPCSAETRFQGIATPSFHPDRLERIARMEAGHFWFVGRRAILQHWLRRIALPAEGLVLDAGCGTGWTVRWLADQGFRVMGVDVLSDGLRDLKARAPSLALVQGDARRLPLRAGGVFAVLLLDVLEHLEDHEALQEAQRVLKPGGWVLLSVPAFPWLWSARDREAGHRRRYTPMMLRSRLKEAGFRIIDMRFYMFLLFPLILASRWAGRHHPGFQGFEERPSRWLNRLLLQVVRLEVAMGRWIRWPWGSTLLALACKDPLCQSRNPGLDGASPQAGEDAGAPEPPSSKAGAP